MKKLISVPCRKTVLEFLDELKDSLPERIFLSEMCVQEFTEEDRTQSDTKIIKLATEEVRSLKLDYLACTNNALRYSGAIYEVVEVSSESIHFCKETDMLETYIILRRECETRVF